MERAATSRLHEPSLGRLRAGWPRLRMARQSTITRSGLECMLCDENAAPKALPLYFLEDITNGFFDELEIGRGGFAVVYKGVLENGAIVAVKRLYNPHLYENEFHREVECLIKAKHKNVVRFIGYCAESQGKAESYNGKFVMADVLQRLLCFEYLPHGTLDNYITEASRGLDWSERYKIINGICEGLHYLHQSQIVHLDLKPQNILLDGNMLPKIADFGLSRCFDEKQTCLIATKICGTMGYMAPEFSSREITYRFDLYSLGVIITEMLTGKKGYEALEDVIERWRNMLEKSQRQIQLEQVQVCAQIAIDCIEYNPAKRPDSTEIIRRLQETPSTDGFKETFLTRLALQAETASSEQHRGARGETSSEAETVSIDPDQGALLGNTSFEFLFDLTSQTQALLKAYKDYAASKCRRSRFSSIDRPKHVQHPALEGLRSKVSCRHLDKQPQLSVEVDVALSSDLAADRWMNFRREVYQVGNQVGDSVLDKLVTEMTLMLRQTRVSNSG